VAVGLIAAPLASHGHLTRIQIGTAPTITVATGARPPQTQNATWTPLSTGRAFVGVTVQSVVAWKGGLVAAGFLDPACRALTPCPTVGNDRAIIDATLSEHLIVDGSRLYLFAGLNPALGPHAGAVAWTSSDATTWKRVDLPEPLNRQSVLSVVDGHGKLVVLSSGPATSAGPGAIWTATDATHWTPTPLNPGGGYVIANEVRDARAQVNWPSPTDPEYIARPDGQLWRP
jgi:hypothetical protein